MVKIERVILSVFDKRRIVELAEVLGEFGAEIIATEGTAAALADGGIKSQSIEDFTGVREMMSGRVKTLHPKIHAGLLGIRENKLHVEEMQTYQCQWVDMVVANLRPLEQPMADLKLSLEEVIEQVDIGGLAMIRSAAKNFRYVTTVVNPDRYGTVIHELKAYEGSVSFTTRWRLAQEAFETTAKYDLTLSDYLRTARPPEE